MAYRLAQHFEYAGLEPDRESGTIATRRLSALGRGRIIAKTTSEFGAPASYDLICAFEVLEHVPDHRDELVHWRRLLRPGGYVLLSVPAHRRRYGAADDAVGHVRRYDRTDLEKALTETGFSLVSIEVWGAGLGHILEWIRHRMARRLESLNTPDASARSGRWLQPRGPLMGLLAGIVAAPFRLLQYPLRRTSIGIGWVALARRPE